MNTSEYLSAVKAKRSLSSDYKLAKVLGISTQLMSRYVKGQSVPGPLVAFRIASILGEQPASVLADLEAERCARMGNDEERQEWEAYTQRLHTPGASILLASQPDEKALPDKALRQVS